MILKKKKNDNIILNCLNMDEINKIILAEQTKFLLDEISKTEYDFIEEINQRKLCSQKLNKYITTFNYIDKILVVLSATSGGVSIISFTNVIGAPVGIASASFTLIFSLKIGIVKKLLNVRKKRKSMIKFLYWLKVNSVVLTD